MNIKQEIIQYIIDNKMSTEEVSDAMGKTGVVKNVYPIAKGQYAVGELQYIYTYDNSNWPIHEQIRTLKADQILFVDTFNVEDMAVFGQLVTRYIIQKSRVKAVVTTGLMRDVSGLLEDGAKVWCSGITPIGCYNKKVEPSEDVLRQSSERKNIYDGSIAVCDDSGVVIIPKELEIENFLEKLKHLHAQEAIWFDCVMNLGWDTFDTVCLKKYLKEER